VALRDDLNLCAPRLRRYARALVAGHPAPNEGADDLVQAVLLRATERGSASSPVGSELCLELYSLLTEWHRKRLATGKLAPPQTAHLEKENFYAGGPRAGGKLPLAAAPRGQLAAALLALPLEEREALLLVVLEGFSHAQAARILKVSREILVSRLARARQALGEIPPAERRPLPAKPFPSYLHVVK